MFSPACFGPLADLTEISVVELEVTANSASKCRTFVLDFAKVAGVHQITEA